MKKLAFLVGKWSGDAIRAYNDRRYLDTEMKVPGNGFEWGYKAGGQWVETGDMKFSDNPPQRTLKMTLRKES